jgi:aldose 1-epimerase
MIGMINKYKIHTDKRRDGFFQYKLNLRNMNKVLPAFVIFLIFLCTCSNEHSKKTEYPLISVHDFDTIYNGKNVSLYTLKNKQGMVAQLTNYGARLVSLWTPDRAGNFVDVVLGYESLRGYLSSNEVYYGATIGRYANRIDDAEFELNEQTYRLDANNGENCLHGGKNGFHNVVWEAEPLDKGSIKFSYFSEDGEAGFPGNLNVSVIYSLTDSNELMIEYRATTDRSTPVNLTHHSFFNLKGAGSGKITDHILMINADQFIPVDSTLIPLGNIVSVDNTPMDFTSPVKIGKRINQSFSQLKYGLGYDHTWVLNTNGQINKMAARVLEPASGRVMEVYTDEPGIQFYSGNFLDGQDTGKYEKNYKYRGALCLETQHYPDSPNQHAFPSTILEPGEEYNSICIYKFGTEKEK